MKMTTLVDTYKEKALQAKEKGDTFAMAYWMQRIKEVKSFV